MKLLLYCCKTKPYLIGGYHKPYYLDKGGKCAVMDARDNILNGKIVGECDFEVEKIIYRETDKTCYSFGTKTLTPDNLLDKSCLTILELCKYIGNNPNWTKGKYGYAIKIKNLHIFDEPRDLSEYSKKVEHCKCDKCLDHCKNYYAKNNITQTINKGCTKYTILYKAPQNMMYVFDLEEKKVLISIHPEWLCKILNGEKTIEVRKKVLKEMI